MTTIVRFCLSYDCFKWDLIALKAVVISIENITLSRTAFLSSYDKFLYIYANKLVLDQNPDQNLSDASMLYLFKVGHNSPKSTDYFIGNSTAFKIVSNI